MDIFRRVVGDDITAFYLVIFQKRVLGKGGLINCIPVTRRLFVEEYTLITKTDELWVAKYIYPRRASATIRRIWTRPFIVGYGGHVHPTTPHHRMGISRAEP